MNKRLDNRRQRGIASIWFVMVIMMLVAFFALAADTFYMTLAAQQLWVGADAAALAGAAHVRDGDGGATARQTAIEYAAANRVGPDAIQLSGNAGNDPAGDIVIGRYFRQTGQFQPIPPGAGLPNAVRVRANRTAGSLGGELALLFAPAIGVDSANVGRWSTAIIGGNVAPGMLVLNESAPCAFRIRGDTATLIVENGSLLVNSDHANAACNSGPANIDAQEFFVRGGTSSQFAGQVELTGELYTDLKELGIYPEPHPDPLADVPEPTYDPANDLGSVNVTGGATVQINTPGYYSGGFEVSSGRLEITQTGIYILDGKGLDVSGSSSVVVTAPEGAMLYIVNQGSVNLKGSGEIDLVPMEYHGHLISIFQARDNTNAADIHGTPNFQIGGMMYFPSNHLKLGGTSDLVAQGLIADTIEIHGTGNIRVTNAGFPNAKRFVYLVE